jgi:hypothetical protein
MSAGFVYVLVNSSMPGIIKVGKTTRTPSERVEELSGVTGVPTPFIVAYEEYFNDCDAAEQFLHTKLTAKGMRTSESREFFRAPVSEVVNLIATIPHSSSSSLGLLPGETRSRRPQENLVHFEEILGRANNSYFGFDDSIQDFAEAMKLYRDAARLGSAEAMEKLGDMFSYGEGVREDKARALEFYKQGAQNGNFYCYATMAKMYLEQGKNENARKAAARFLADGEADGWASYKEFRSIFGTMFHLLNTLEIIRASQDEKADFCWLFVTYIDRIAAAGRVLVSKPQAKASWKGKAEMTLAHLESMIHLQNERTSQPR